MCYLLTVLAFDRQLDAIESIYPTEVQFDQEARRVLCEAIKGKEQGEGATIHLHSHTVNPLFGGTVVVRVLGTTDIIY